MSLGKNIYNLRKEKNYSQEELANKCNVSRQTISKWEADEVMPDTNNLIALSKLFNITIDELINNEVISEKPDVFDKSVKLVKKHWAKIGYYFIYIGGGSTIGAFIMKSLIKNSFNMQNDFMNQFPTDIPGFAFGNGFQNSVQSPFYTIANFALLIGLVLLGIGIGLIIYDRKLNHPKTNKS